MELFAEHSCDAAIRIDRDGNMEFVSSACAEHFGQPAHVLTGQPLSHYMVPRDYAAFRKQYGLLLAASPENGVARLPDSFDLTLVSPFGAVLPLRVRLFRMQGCDQVWVAGQDVREQKMLEERFNLRLYREQRTGLASGVALFERLESWVAQPADSLASVTQGAVLAIRFDGLRRIKQALGYCAQDGVVRTLASRLESALPEDSLIARTSEDILAIALKTPEGELSLNKLNATLLQLIQLPLSVGEQDVFVSANIGFVAFPRDATTVEELLERADSAVYAAAQLGPNTSSRYSPDSTAMAKEGLSLNSAMHAAIREGELFLDFQPLVTVEGALVGCEALMRWRRADGQMVSPAEFIPLAEDNGLIVLLGEYAIRAAAMQLKRFDAAGLKDLYVSVNVSPRQLSHPHFEKTLTHALSLTGLDPKRLVLELTEGLLLSGDKHIKDILDKIVKTGVRLSIDDFGTGYSSLSYLNAYPVSALKIDRSFIIDLVDNPDAQEIVKVIIGLAKALKLTTVVEGVETKEQVHILSSMDVDCFQGYFFGKPMAPAELISRFVPKNLVI